MKYLKANRALITTILTIAFPAIVEMSMNTLVGVADTIMVSHFVGPSAVAAAGYANQLIFTIIFIFSSFNTGAIAMISRSFGEKDYIKLNRVSGQNMMLNIVIGIILTVCTILFGGSFLKIFDTTVEVYEMGKSYLDYVSYSQVFMFISFAAAATLRGASDTKSPMIITGVVNILNIIGNYFLITGFWIFPEMGVAGAALSTTLSRVIGTVIYLIVLFKGTNGIRLEWRLLKLTRDVLGSLWKLSSTAAIEQFLMQTSFFVVGIFISILDTTSEAAYRILLSIESTSFMPAIGLSIAASALVGKALGEKDKEKAKHVGYISFGMGILWGILAGAVFILFPSFILRMFTTDASIIEISVDGLAFVGMDQPFFAFILIIAGVLRGAGDTKKVMLISSLRVWLLFVPLTYVFVTYAGLGIKSVWVAEIIALLITGIIMFKRFRSEKWSEIVL